MAEAISFENVSISFNHTPVLEDITLKVDEKDFLAILGPNGGGKSTLLRAALGLVKPDRGKVEVMGLPPEKARPLVGYLPQQNLFALDFPITAFEVVLMGMYKGLFHNYSLEDEKAAGEVLKTVGMQRFAERQISELSGGEMQRVFIARALARKPKILLLDEPTSSIDPEMQGSFYRMLSGLRERMTIVFVTHDISVISSEVSRFACLNRRLYYHGSGEGVAGRLEELYNCPIEVITHGMPHKVLRGKRDD